MLDTLFHACTYLLKILLLTICWISKSKNFLELQYKWNGHSFPKDCSIHLVRCQYVGNNASTRDYSSLEDLIPWRNSREIWNFCFILFHIFICILFNWNYLKWNPIFAEFTWKLHFRNAGGENVSMLRWWPRAEFPTVSQEFNQLGL